MNHSSIFTLKLVHLCSMMHFTMDEMKHFANNFQLRNAFWVIDNVGIFFLHLSSCWWCLSNFFSTTLTTIFLTSLKVTLIFFERMKKLIKKQHLSIKFLLVWHGNVIKIDEIFQMDLHQHFFKANHNYQFFTCQSPIWNESKISRIFHLKFFLHPPHTLLLSKWKYNWRWLCELWAHK